ncbi:outer membrane protein, multidrug efflux system [Paracoccus halophilus]|uniref:Outer membrane protein, multidrug efflux system n=2 Tax=Paracoccus halophilus TaxID=376733 RepID=A0A1I0U9C4_9RHOB|nr:efflux transporter outer membrane subunit [Paracoccus halophilus]SFA60682.1 outer membrane protein, multidrug efflux system [Paracoccus halophilus]
MTDDNDQEMTLPRRPSDNLRYAHEGAANGSVMSRRGLVTGMGATLALLAACSEVSYTEPQADVAMAFSGDSPARHAGANTWWHAFRDPQLDHLIAAGLARNLDVHSAIATIHEAEANARLVGASDLPQVNAEAAARRHRDEAGIVESSSATLGVSWLIDLFGQNRAAREGAAARLDAAWLSADVARLTVLSAVASAYVDARYFQEARSLTRQSLESRRHSLGLTRSESEFGSAGRLEVLQAEQLVVQAEAELPAFEVGFDQAINRLATLTAGRTADIAARMRKGGAQPRARYSASVGVPADVIRARPDVRMAERSLAAAVADVGEAQADFYPRLTLSGSITPTNVRRGGSTTTWGFGPQISLPLFTGGANEARLSAAQARAEKARITWQAAVLRAVEEVENALAGYNRDGRAVDAQNRLVTNARETVDLTRYSYEQGQADFFPVLDAERHLLSARQGLAAAARQQALNFIALSAASAGGIGLATG